MSSLFLVGVLFLFKLCVCEVKKRPHIVFILADDLGWNDVSYRGSNEIFTPNIDALAYSGLIVHNHYSETLCSPSRAALLTGKYPIHTGMHHDVVLETHPSGLPLEEKIMPQYLKSLGYKSHAVGKWHLGFYKKEYTPQYRGFDSFYGFWNGYQDYYKHNVQAWLMPYDGYDMRRNSKVDWSAVGKYSTDLFTNEAVNIIRKHDKQKPLFLYLAHAAPHAATFEDPLQAPAEEILKYAFIHDERRRRYAAMVSKLDESVGKVVKALHDNSMLKDAIIVFTSDNGAPTTGIMRNYGSNWPLKGEKITPWEGGIRTGAIVWSKLLRQSPRITTQAMHITDWLPTLFSAAGGGGAELGQIDGTNMWDILIGTKPENKDYEILHNIDENGHSNYAAFRSGSYKYVNGSSLIGYLDDWFGTFQQSNIPRYDLNKVRLCTVNRILSPRHNISEEKITKIRNSMRVRCESIKYHRSNATNFFLPCKSLKNPCLFNIIDDPCELRNLYDLKELKKIRVDMENKIRRFKKTIRPFISTKPDKLSNPALHNNTWISWGDEITNEITL